MSTDGGSNMSSLDAGLLGCIRRNNPNMVYQGCASHRLNLAIKVACEIEEIFPAFQHLNTFAVIVKNSKNRVQKYREIVKRLHQEYGNIDIRKMPVQIGGTRWLGKQMAMNSAMKNDTSFILMYECLYGIHTINELKPVSEENITKIATMFFYWSNYNNIVKAHLVDKVLTACKKTTLSLQKATLQIYDMINEISDLYMVITEYLDLENQSKMLAEAVKFADIVFNKINTNGRTLIFKDANIDNWGKNMLEFFSKFLRTIQVQLQCKYIDEFRNNVEFYKEIQQLDPMSFHSLDLDLISFGELCKCAGFEHHTVLEQFKQLAATHSMSFRGNEQESYNKRINLLFEFICQEDNKDSFRDVVKLYKYVLSLPCTEVKCERDFSHLRYVKTYNRSLMNDQSLENEMLLLLNKDVLMNLNFDDVINKICLISKKLNKLLLLKTI